MCKTLRALAISAGILVFASGCAGVTARKVPLEARLNDRDDKIDGFRYYTSRPYFVVNKRISLGFDAQVGVLGYLENDESKLVLAVPVEGGEVKYYDGNGESIEKASGFKPILRKEAEKPEAEKPEDPPAPAPPPGTPGNASNPDSPEDSGRSGGALRGGSN